MSSKHLQCCSEFKIIAKRSGQSRDHLDQSKSTPWVHHDPRISIVPISLYTDSFMFMFVYFVFICSVLHICQHAAVDLMGLKPNP